MLAVAVTEGGPRNLILPSVRIGRTAYAWYSFFFALWSC